MERIEICQGTARADEAIDFEHDAHQCAVCLFGWVGDSNGCHYDGRVQCWDVTIAWRDEDGTTSETGLWLTPAASSLRSALVDIERRLNGPDWADADATPTVVGLVAVNALPAR